MSPIRQRIVPLAASTALLIAAGLVVEGGLADEPKSQEEILYSTDGLKVRAVCTDQGCDALTPKGGGEVALKDGTYKLTNGGAIRVESGRIVWDAFGAIERIKANGLSAGPVGLA